MYDEKMDFYIIGSRYDRNNGRLQQYIKYRTGFPGKQCAFIQQFSRTFPA